VLALRFTPDIENVLPSLSVVTPRAELENKLTVLLAGLALALLVQGH